MFTPSLSVTSIEQSKTLPSSVHETVLAYAGTGANHVKTIKVINSSRLMV